VLETVSIADSTERAASIPEHGRRMYRIADATQHPATTARTSSG
jgi:hypothetical protein